jgi:hypothetical protein
MMMNDQGADRLEGTGCGDAITSWRLGAVDALRARAPIHGT